MVTTQITDKYTAITLSPNRSTDWKDIKRWLIFLSLPALFVAIGWFAMGVWIILPLVGIELGLLTYFMYKVCYQNYRVQKIIIQKKQVILEAGIQKLNQVQLFQRPDCYLVITEPTSPMENLELTLSSDEGSYAIGGFLNSEDKGLARRSLIKAGLIECSSLWWQKNNR